MSQKKTARIDLQAYANISGAMVRAVRQHRKLSVRDLAEMAGISKTTLLRIEADEQVRAVSYVRLCKGLKVMPEQLQLPTDGQDIHAPVRIIPEASTPYRVCYLTPTAPSNLTELMLVDDPVERQRLAGLGFVNGFLRVIPGLVDDATFNAAVFEPRSIEGAVYQANKPHQPNTHAGREFAYCLQGPLDLMVDGRRHRMQTGDAAFFDSSLDHTCALAGPVTAGPQPRLLVVWIDQAMPSGQ